MNATDPVPSSANAPAAKDIPASAPPPGKNSFRLIGVSEFNLPAHRDHTVIIKGLLIKATPHEPAEHDLGHHRRPGVCRRRKMS